MARIWAKPMSLIAAAILAASAVAVAQAMAQPEPWQKQSGPWAISDGPLPNGEREVAMVRNPEDGSRYRYEALPGGERRIAREACDGTEQTIWLTGDRAANLAAARAALLAAARPGADCSIDETGVATSDFDAAFSSIEDRLQARPFADVMAWRMDSDDAAGPARTRGEGAVRIDYLVAGTAQDARVRLTAQACGGGRRQFERRFANADSREGQVAAASAALGSVLAEAQRACGLDAGAPARLSRGFAEAVAADFLDADEAVICRAGEACNAM